MISTKLVLLFVASILALGYCGYRYWQQWEAGRVTVRQRRKRETP